MMHSENEVYCFSNLGFASASSKQLNDRFTRQDAKLQMGLRQEGWSGRGLIQDRVLPRPSNATPTISLLAGRRYQWGQNATRRYSKNSKRGSGYGLSLENLHQHLSQYKGKAYKILVTEHKALTIIALGGLSYDNGLPGVGCP